MKIKTRELEGAALKWAVDKAEGWDDEMLAALARQYAVRRSSEQPLYWEDVGPLIEEHLIELHTNTGEQHDEHERWYAVVPTSASGSRGAMGSTPLIAAMRALVFAKLGEAVDVPDELLQTTAERRE